MYNKVIYRGCNKVKSKKHNKYYETLDKMLRVYNSAGFQIKTIECDGKYKDMMENIKDDLDVTMIYTNTKDHVTEAEKNNSNRGLAIAGIIITIISGIFNLSFL